MGKSNGNHPYTYSWLSGFKWWNGMRLRDMRNDRHAGLMGLAWICSLVLGGGLIKVGLEVTPLAVGWVIVPALLGMLFVRAYLKFLREADELLRKSHIEAMAVGFGTGWIGGISFYTVIAATSGAARGVYGAIILILMIVGYVTRLFLASRAAAKDSDA